MLHNLDLSRKVAKDEFKTNKDKLQIRIASLQRRAHELKIPVIIVFEGWGASGKGTLINELIQPLDPRGFKVCSTNPPNEEESLKPFLWRFWKEIPSRGRVAVFDRSWYQRVYHERVTANIAGKQLQQSFHDICSFERQLTDDGYVLIKFFLHISKQVQKRRFDKLLKNEATAWRVSEDDKLRNKQYDVYLNVIEEMIAETDTEYGPWTVVEAHDRRFAILKLFSTVAACMENAIAKAENKKKESVQIQNSHTLPSDLSASILDQVDLSQNLKRTVYRSKLKQKQKRIRELEHEVFRRRIPVVIVYEGWDAAGKGGNIRRLTQNLDPRGYEVTPIAAPNVVEMAHHYLWRFWIQMPKAGHLSIFDRSWYGRVMVERIEGFCHESEWKRAYREINEMEKHLFNFGTVIVKFWIHIDDKEQLRRFEERKKIEHKQWKITDEDWRNREKWSEYKLAVEEMLFRTSTPHAPWTIVESNCKWFARIKALDTVIDAIEARIK